MTECRLFFVPDLVQLNPAPHIFRFKRYINNWMFSRFELWKKARRSFQKDRNNHSAEGLLNLRPDSILCNICVNLDECSRPRLVYNSAPVSSRNRNWSFQCRQDPVGWFKLIRPKDFQTSWIELYQNGKHMAFAYGNLCWRFRTCEFNSV